MKDVQKPKLSSGMSRRLNLDLVYATQGSNDGTKIFFMKGLFPKNRFFHERRTKLKLLGCFVNLVVQALIKPEDRMMVHKYFS